MIFQDPYQTLNPRQRVSAIVTEPLVVQRVARGEHEARVQRALEDVGLEPDRFADRYPHQLSGGQRQRVAIAAALVLEPEGLICDEPVSMLDASVRAQILAVLLELQRRRNLALIFITHDLSLAWSLCDRIAVMYLGRVVEQGSAVEVIEHPQHPYTQALVTAIPVPTPGGGGKRELLTGELPDATDVPSGLSLSPALSEALRALRSGRSGAARDGPARAPGGLPVARSDPGTPVTMVSTERWREIAGPGRPNRARSAKRDHRRARRPGRSRAGGEWPAHRRHRRGAAVSAGARGSGDGERLRRADGQARDRRARGDEDPRVPLRNARGGHGPSGRGACVGQGPRRRRAAGGRRVRRWRHGRFAHRDRRATSSGRSRVSAPRFPRAASGPAPA